MVDDISFFVNRLLPKFLFKFLNVTPQTVRTRKANRNKPLLTGRGILFFTAMSAFKSGTLYPVQRELLQYFNHTDDRRYRLNSLLACGVTSRHGSQTVMALR